MKRLEASRISFLCDRSRLDAALGILGSRALPLASVQAWRSVRLGKARHFSLPGSGPALAEAPAALVRAWVEAGSEQALMAALRRSAGAGRPGGGSLWAERIQLIHHSIESLPAPESEEGSQAVPGRLAPLAGIVCVVPRGEGNQVARLVLGMGLSAPMVGFGKGMGLRNRLGLIRVTIPAGKEVVLFLCPPHDAAEALSFLRDALALHEAPGKAFLYSFPAALGMADTLISRSESVRHVASMEQVIAAIDELSGSPAWRRNSPSGDPVPSSADHIPPAGPALSCLSLSCLEGQAEEHIRIAMDLGAAGATLTRSVAMGWDAEGKALPREARESSDIILPTVLAEPIMDALAFSGFFSAEAGVMAEIGPVERAAAFKPLR